MMGDGNIDEESTGGVDTINSDESDEEMIESSGEGS